MTRAKAAVAAHARRKRILKLAKGYRGTRGRLFRAAKDAVWHARQYAFQHRRERKRDFRRLWIARINAAARSQGVTYSRFQAGLKTAGIDLNRKMLAELAVMEPKAFATIVSLAKPQTA
jgi:large subunit ribosomal protein L20